MKTNESIQQGRENHNGKGKADDVHEHKEHPIQVFVNENPVILPDHTATGAEIKAAAIEQGVLIQQNFVLQEELANGTSRIVGDNDTVHLHKHLRFTAIAPDDNS